RETILIEFEERDKLNAEKQRLQAYLKELDAILKDNPRLSDNVGVGYQLFDEFCYNHLFYVDKTYFINEWLNTSEKVTLITRPRRFGKTLLLSTVKEFFDTNSNCSFKDFEDLAVAKDLHTASLFRSRPVVFISFAGVKGANMKSALEAINFEIYNCFFKHSYLLESDRLTIKDKDKINHIINMRFDEDDSEHFGLIQLLCQLIYIHHGIKPYILIDEYDTPITESYAYDFFDEMIVFYRKFINHTLKSNDYYERAIVTGITVVAKNSLFSDMNNISINTCTVDKYTDCFGFTEQEVKDALKCQDVKEFEAVKAMYDGFIFGNTKDIYNPWSICNYINRRVLFPYWIGTSSNSVIAELLRKCPISVKLEFEELMSGKSIHKTINEYIAYQYLDGDPNSFYSLLLATGYVKAENAHIDSEGFTECDITITNLETKAMFKNQITYMVSGSIDNYGYFLDHLLNLKFEHATRTLNGMLYSTISYFDAAKSGDSAPENFYHGLVLGLIASCQDRYIITSNRESGIGRYDVVMQPRNDTDPAFVMEFKVFDEKKEKTLEDTAKRALTQIEEKKYAADLITRGIEKRRIHRLGFAFKDKEALICEG
nr:ATP-binding protein [Lachnospiraceae bacterium]